MMFYLPLAIQLFQFLNATHFQKVSRDSQRKTSYLSRCSKNFKMHNVEIPKLTEKEILVIFDIDFMSTIPIIDYLTARIILQSKLFNQFQKMKEKKLNQSLNLVEKYKYQKKKNLFTKAVSNENFEVQRLIYDQKFIKKIECDNIQSFFESIYSLKERLIELKSSSSLKIRYLLLTDHNEKETYQVLKKLQIEELFEVVFCWDEKTNPSGRYRKTRSDTFLFVEKFYNPKLLTSSSANSACSNPRKIKNILIFDDRLEIMSLSQTFNWSCFYLHDNLDEICKFIEIYIENLTFSTKDIKATFCETLKISNRQQG